MTGKEFFRSVCQGPDDVVRLLLDLLAETRAAHCVIGGLAVNAYAEPVVSLDLDLVVIADKIADLANAAKAKGMRVEQFEHSVNLSLQGSDLRIQLQTDSRYQPFLKRGKRQQVLGYEMTVASLEDVLAGKIWAYSDKNRLKSKRQKDLADIMRLTEAHPELKSRLPAPIAALVEEDQ